jgi:hypothetical protein
MEKLKRPLFLRQKALPFFGVAVLWLILGQFLAWRWSSSFDQAILACQWMFIFWALCILDLLALVKLISIAFQWINSTLENRPVYLIQTLSWGGIKLVCLGFFIGILLKEQHIPMHGLLLGLGTLAIVPWVGGFFWSQRILQDA